MLKTSISVFLSLTLMLSILGCKRAEETKLSSEDSDEKYYEDLAASELAKLTPSQREAFITRFNAESAKVKSMTEDELFRELVDRSVEIYVRKASSFAAEQSRA